MNIFKKEKKTLTDSHKRSIIRNEGNVWVLRFGKSVTRFFKTLIHTVTTKFGGKIPFSIKKFFSRYLGGKVPMKSLKLKSSFGRRFAATFAVALVAIVLVACGGGGSGAPAVAPAVVPPVVTITCWNGTTAATAPACPVVTTPVVALNSANLPVITFAPGATSTGGTLTAVAGASAVVYAVQSNGTVILVSGAQLFSTLYTYTLTVAYSNGPNQTVAGTYTTGVAPVVCVAPAMTNSNGVCMPSPGAGYTWNTAMKAWVANIGTLVTGANTLPAACVTVGDACWLASVANGTVKLVASGAVATGLNTRPIVFAFFIVSSGFTAGYYNVLPLYADTAAESAYANQSVANGSQGNTITDVKGSTLGAKQTIPPFGCGERVWTGTGFGLPVIACPI